MRTSKTSLYGTLLAVFMFLLPVASFAQITNPLGNGGPTSIPAFIKTLLTGAIKVGIPVVALAIIYCGFLFVAAQGKPEKITEAKNAFMYTLIGAAILLGSWAIAQLISSTVTGLS